MGSSSECLVPEKMNEVENGKNGGGRQRGKTIERAGERRSKHRGASPVF